MKPITTQILVQCGATPAHAPAYVDVLNKHLHDYGINSLLRLAYFLSNVIHESQGLSRTEENLNYSAEALMATWPTRFKSIERAEEFAHQPEKIANYVYANRLGNGPPESGDGWRYRGRGNMQNTGKDKYIDQTEQQGIDFVAHPEKLAEPVYGMIAALNFWKDNKLNGLADTDDPAKVTKRINGALNGIAERKALLSRCKRVLIPLFA